MTTASKAPMLLAEHKPVSPWAWARRSFQGRALAVFVLAAALIRVTFKRAMGRRTGLALFRDNYDDDRLPPVDAEERAALPSLSGCIACGRCDLGEADRMARSQGAYPGLMQVVLASSRSMPDHDAAARALVHVPDAVLADKMRICPAAVDFVALARFVRRHAVHAPR